LRTASFSQNAAAPEPGDRKQELLALLALLAEQKREMAFGIRLGARSKSRAEHSFFARLVNAASARSTGGAR
jgi:hypothetical protein